MMKRLLVVFLTILLMGAACVLTAHAQRVVRRPSGALQLFIARFDGQARLMDVETGAVIRTWRNKARPRDGARNVKDVAVRLGSSTGFFAGVGAM